MVALVSQRRLDTTIDLSLPPDSGWWRRVVRGLGDLGLALLVVLALPVLLVALAAPIALVVWALRTLVDRF